MTTIIFDDLGPIDSTAAHNCFDYRERGVFEGDDCMIERCARCGRVRMEADGKRPSAWVRTGPPEWPWRYAYSDPKPNHGDHKGLWTGEDARGFHQVRDGYDWPQKSYGA